MKMKRLEKLLIVGAVLSVVCSVSFVYAAARSQYQIAKPMMLNIVAVPPSIKPEGFTFQTDLASKRWTAMVVYLVNTGPRAMGTDGVIAIYDSMYREVATGSGRSSLILPEQTGSVTIHIEWIPGASILDATSMEVNLQEFDDPGTGEG